MTILPRLGLFRGAGGEKKAREGGGEGVLPGDPTYSPTARSGPGAMVGIAS